VAPKKDSRSLFDLRPRRDEERRSEAELRQGIRAAGAGMTIPFALLSGPLLGYFLGSWLDARYSSTWIMPLCVVLGLLGSLKLTVQLVRQLNR